MLVRSGIVHTSDHIYQWRISNLPGIEGVIDGAFCEGRITDDDPLSLLPNVEDGLIEVCGVILLLAGGNELRLDSAFI